MLVKGKNPLRLWMIIPKSPEAFLNLFSMPYIYLLNEWINKWMDLGDMEPDLVEKLQLKDF